MVSLSGRETFLALPQFDAGVKVLLASGYSLAGEAQELLRKGARGFLQKPCRRATLVEELGKVAQHESAEPWFRPTARVCEDQAMRRGLLGVMLSSCLAVSCVHKAAGGSSADGPRKATAASPHRPPPVAADDRNYYRQMAPLVDSSDATAVRALDFVRLRHGSMQVHHAGDPASERALREAIKTADEERIISAARRVLQEDPTHLKAHIVLINLLRKAGKTEGAAFHDLWVHGLLDSIAESGDGRTPSSAIRVYFVREEYDFLHVLGLEVLQQGLKPVEAQQFDVMTVKNAEGKQRDVFFEITEIFAEEGKAFGL